MPIHIGQGFVQGQVGGEATHTLTVNELPAHVHPAIAQPSAGTVGSPINAVWAAGTSAMYAGTADTVMNGAAIGNAGGSQPHDNQPPYLALNFVIALFGIFPSRN
jgi:microcystin-dependent protein